MKSIVVYKSGTGFTEKYAGWIADELKCEAVELKDFKKFSPSDFDLVVFGGWIMGGCLMGFDKIKVLNLKKEKKCFSHFCPYRNQRIQKPDGSF